MLARGMGRQHGAEKQKVNRMCGWDRTVEENLHSGEHFLNVNAVPNVRETPSKRAEGTVYLAGRFLSYLNVYPDDDAGRRLGRNGRQRRVETFVDERESSCVSLGRA